MELNGLLRKIAYKFDDSQDTLFTYDVDKQKDYISRLGQPKDNIQRSYFQYKCQMELSGKWRKFVLNVLAVPMICVYKIKYRNTHVMTKCAADAVFLPDGKPSNIVPQSLKNRFAQLETNPDDGLMLTTEDRSYIAMINKRYPFSPFFTLKCLAKIARYRYIIEKYNPSSIIVCAEYSFTSSLLTDYCEINSREHIDVMHGEKLFHMRDAFFNYHKCYVWNKHYIDLFIELGAGEGQFILEEPRSLIFDAKKSEESVIDFTFYLAGETKDTLLLLSRVVRRFRFAGHSVRVRPHPRYSRIDVIESLFDKTEIEYSNSIDIETSIMRTKHVVALYSTVLYQAYCNGIEFVIDDITDVERYTKLKKMEYLCMKLPHKNLSFYMPNEGRY